jgi:hypothetical protein
MVEKILSLLASLLNFNKITHKGLCVVEKTQEIILVFDNQPPSVLTNTLEKNNISFDIDKNVLFIYFN